MGGWSNALWNACLQRPPITEIILRLYELRTEAVMRRARAWMTGEFWPTSPEEFFAVASNPADPHNAWLRQVLTYWEMAAAMVLHGAVSAELFVDCNAEGFFLLAKFAPILQKKDPGKRIRGSQIKTSELVTRFSAAAQRYEAVLKNVAARRNDPSPPKSRKPTANIPILRNPDPRSSYRNPSGGG